MLLDQMETEMELNQLVNAVVELMVELMNLLKKYLMEDKDHRHYYHEDSYSMLMLEHWMVLDYSFVSDTL
jgi:hypothetical protein